MSEWHIKVIIHKKQEQEQEQEQKQETKLFVADPNRCNFTIWQGPPIHHLYCRNC